MVTRAGLKPPALKAWYWFRVFFNRWIQKRMHYYLFDMFNDDSGLVHIFPWKR